MPSAEPRHIAYVLKMYPRLAETFILNEILAHEEAGVELEIFSLRSPIDGRFHADLGRVRAHVTYLKGPSVKADDFWEAVCWARREMPEGAARVMAEDRGERAADIYQAIHLARELRERGVQHIHAHFATAATTVARLASRLSGIPYSFTAHAKDIYDETVDGDDLARKLRDAASVVTVSDFNVKHLRDRYGTHADVVRRIYNGLDLSEFSYRTPDERPPLVLGIGRLVEKKGFCDLIEACRILAERGRSFQCEIIGHGVLEKKLAAQVTELGLEEHVTMCGPRSRSDVIERIQDAAVLAVPCVISESGNRDGMPTVILEAMALGTPCISTDVTGIPEIVRHEDTGLITPAHDPASLAVAIERLLDDAALRCRLAKAARRLMEAEYDIHRNTPVLREVFVAGAGRPAAFPATRVVVG